MCVYIIYTHTYLHTYIHIYSGRAEPSRAKPEPTPPLWAPDRSFRAIRNLAVHPRPMELDDICNICHRILLA